MNSLEMYLEGRNDFLLHEYGCEQEKLLFCEKICIHMREELFSGTGNSPLFDEIENILGYYKDSNARIPNVWSSINVLDTHVILQCLCHMIQDDEYNIAQDTEVRDNKNLPYAFARFSSSEQYIIKEIQTNYFEVKNFHIRFLSNIAAVNPQAEKKIAFNENNKPEIVGPFSESEDSKDITLDAENNESEDISLDAENNESEDISLDAENNELEEISPSAENNHQEENSLVVETSEIEEINNITHKQLVEELSSLDQTKFSEEKEDFDSKIFYNAETMLKIEIEEFGKKIDFLYRKDTAMKLFDIYKNLKYKYMRAKNAGIDAEPINTMLEALESMFESMREIIKDCGYATYESNVGDIFDDAIHEELHGGVNHNLTVLLSLQPGLYYISQAGQKVVVFKEIVKLNNTQK